MTKFLKIVSFTLAVGLIGVTFSACGKTSNNAVNLETETNSEANVNSEETTEDLNWNTGDASKDNIRNQDEIGKNELLVVSFGTSYNDSRRLTIGAIEDTLEKAFPDYSVRRGFTSNIIIDHIYKRDGIKIDDVKTALNRAVDNGVENLVVQPTHLMNGKEYNELTGEIAEFSDSIKNISIGKPLLSSDDDYEKVAKAITSWTSDYDDGETAICFMGHGTDADSNEDYAKLQKVLTNDGYENYFVGTVEATPSVDDLIKEIKKNDKYKKVVIEPLMVVAGDHANNDMAGDGADSWKSKFEAAGYEVTPIVRGLGENEDIRKIYVEHAQEAIDELNK